MKLDIILSAGEIKEDKIKDKTVVVIDVFRATSVIITAIKNGCKELIPVLTTEEAFQIKEQSSCLLCGERNAVKVHGFDLSNSPLEYTKDKIFNKTIVLSTTNGTRAVKGCNGARNLLIGGIINGQAVAEKAIELNNDVVVVNAGTGGSFSIDDFISSGFIISAIIEIKEDVQLTDVAKTALYIYENNKGITEFIKNAAHYERMKELKLFDDLDYCCQKNITSVVPEVINGRIK
ncbi:MAG: 2-phosphosulfolactate phosphatase [Solirubrobacterales bacterium]